jgi:hypothetical protein
VNGFRFAATGLVATIGPTLAANGHPEPGMPEVLFERRFATVNNPSGDSWYDVSPDGRRFLMLKPDETSGSKDRHGHNWLEELNQRVRAK